MDLRSLMNKLDTIAERSLPMPGDGGRAQYDKFKADDARAAAVAQVKQWMSTPLSDIARLGDAIDPKTGIIYYGDAGAERGGGDRYEAKPYPYKWLADPSSTSTQSREMYKVLGPAGLKVIPVEKKQLFGTTQVAGISLQQLADLDKPVAPVPGPDKPVDIPAQDTKPTNKADCDKSIAQLNALSAKLQARMDALASVKKESRESMAQALMEEFGYEIPEGYYVDNNGMLVEYSMKDFTGDVGDTARGGFNGITFGTGDNIQAGLKSAFSKDTYAQALAREKANTAAAEKRSPYLYKGGELAGMIAAPVPGGAAVGAAMKGASGLAKFGAQAGLNLGVGMAADAATGAHNSKVLGADWKEKAEKTAAQSTKPVVKPTGDPKVIALQNKLISAGAKIKADGVMGPATQAAMKQFPMVKESLAESMGSLRDRLALIEREHRDYTDVSVDEDRVKAATELGGKAIEKGRDAYNGIKSWFNTPTVNPLLKKPGQTPPIVKPNTTVKPTTTPTGTVYKKKADSPNIAAEVPYVQGRAGSGTNPGQFAKFDPATSAVANATKGVDDMVRGGVKATADDAAKLAKDGKALGAVDDAAKLAKDGKAAGGFGKSAVKHLAAAGALGALSQLGGDTNGPGPNGPVVVPPRPPGPNGPVDIPAQDTKPDAETQAIIDQMKKLMMDCGEYDAPAWAQATSNAMALIGKVEAKKGGEAQVAADREAAMRVPASANASSSYTGVPAGTRISR
jgi:hypothetical protein